MTIAIPIQSEQCPACHGTDLVEEECDTGSLCNMICGGGGRHTTCATCGNVVREEECEEAEED